MNAGLLALMVWKLKNFTRKRNKRKPDEKNGGDITKQLIFQLISHILLSGISHETPPADQRPYSGGLYASISSKIL
jgi:hypothetical protein